MANIRDAFQKMYTTIILSRIHRKFHIPVMLNLNDWFIQTHLGGKYIVDIVYSIKRAYERGQ